MRIEGARQLRRQRRAPARGLKPAGVPTPFVVCWPKTAAFKLHRLDGDKFIIMIYLVEYAATQALHGRRNDAERRRFCEEKT